MAQHTIEFTAAQEAAVQARADRDGVTLAQLIAGTAAELGEANRADLYNRWWGGLDLDAQQALYEAAQ